MSRHMAVVLAGLTVLLAVGCSAAPTQIPIIQQTANAIVAGAATQEASAEPPTPVLTPTPASQPAPIPASGRTPEPIWTPVFTVGGSGLKAR